MSSPDVFLKYLAFAVMTLTGVLGWVVAARSAFSDFETSQAVGTSAPWLVMAIALSAFAFWSRRSRLGPSSCSPRSPLSAAQSSLRAG